jgi:hypothetical protein
VSARDWLRRILLPFLLTRSALALVGLLALTLLGSARERMPGNLVAHAPAPAALEIWARWDAEWYLLIAREGYRVQAHLEGYSVGYHPEDATGFFPLYPALIALMGKSGWDLVAAGVVVSNVFLLAALSLLFLLVREEMGEEAAAASLWVLLAYPFSLFLSAVYSESTALALTLGSFLLARRRRWAGLALCGFFCALSRPTACIAAPALAWEVWERRGGWKGFAALAGFPAGVAAFSLACQRLFGDPWIWIERQQRWRGGVSGPWQAFRRFLESKPQLHGAHNSVLELLFAVAFLGLLLPVLRRTPRSWSIYTLLTVLLPLGSTLWSFGRLELLAFPVFAWGGWTLSRGSSRLAGYLAFAAPLGGLLMAFFACGWWAG